LCDASKELLVHLLAEHETWEVSDFADAIELRTGIKWSDVAVWRAFKELGISRKLLFNRAAEADPALNTLLSSMLSKTVMWTSTLRSSMNLL
jgi:hypothetical protein